MKRDSSIHLRMVEKFNGKLGVGNGMGEWHDVGLVIKTKHGTSIDEQSGERIKATGGVTVFVHKRGDGNLSWGFAKCNDKDVYNKRVGRAISNGRALQNGTITKDVDYSTILEVARSMGKIIWSMNSTGGRKLTEITDHELNTLVESIERMLEEKIS